jgi:hypothetical protein
VNQNFDLIECMLAVLVSAVVLLLYAIQVEQYFIGVHILADGLLVQAWLLCHLPLLSEVS